MTTSKYKINFIVIGTVKSTKQHQTIKRVLVAEAGGIM